MIQNEIDLTDLLKGWLNNISVPERSVMLRFVPDKTAVPDNYKAAIVGALTASIGNAV